jgi:hypothetical protein
MAAMICHKAFPFIREFLDQISLELKLINDKYALTTIQKAWIAFCIVGIFVTGTICWSQFERYSLGRYSVSALSWMLRKSKIIWEFLLITSVRVILRKYSIKKGHLVIDDTDRMRSKNTTEIDKIHKIYDKKTGGYFMGQNIVFLLLVTDKITIPVGFKLHVPDPEKILWNKNDEELRRQNVPKSERPKPPISNPDYPSKIEISLQLLENFKIYFSDIEIKSISADAAYGSKYFFQKTGEKFKKSQIISQLRNNQKVLFKNKLTPVSEVFNSLPKLETEIEIRGGKKKLATMSSARLKVDSHDAKQFVVALKYEDEEDFRYIVASDLTWRAEDIVKAYTLRWLVEVFISDWKRYEGWGQLALQQGIEGSFRGVILSLLVDLCLLFHPNQFARIENKYPACTVGSLTEKLKNESLLTCFEEILLSKSPVEEFLKTKDKLQEFFIERQSSKHLSDRDFEISKSPSLEKRYGRLEVHQM